MSEYIVFTFYILWRCFNIALREKDLPVNDQIRCHQMMVIGPNGEQLGVKNKNDALTLANYSGFDLVLINESSNPPVCKLLDYNKFKYEKKKKVKESQKKQREVNTEIKEYRLSVTIDTHDFETKVTNVIKYLKKNHKIKVSIRFKGRQMAHTVLGKEVLDRFFNAVEEYAVMEQAPKLDGKNMFMGLAPKK